MRSTILNSDSELKFGFYAKYVKRFLDIIISCILFSLLWPLFVILSVLISINLGMPILFTQNRAGKDEKTFKMIKFRSMANFKDLNGDLLPDEQRFTNFGTFLRKTSLDELPELFNVLKGEMSLVGPRPLYDFYLPYYTKEEALRHSVRGGITGLAQINGRALCPMDTRLKYDVTYVKNITFFGDLKILYQTVFKVLKRSEVGMPSVDDEKMLSEIRDIQRPELAGKFNND